MRKRGLLISLASMFLIAAVLSLGMYWLAGHLRSRPTRPVASSAMDLGQEEWALTGQVVDEQGRGVAGAEVLIAGPSRGEGPAVTARATADREGRFRLAVEEIPSPARASATGQGYEPGVVDPLDLISQIGPLTITLGSGATLRGRVACQGAVPSSSMVFLPGRPGLEAKGGSGGEYALSPLPAGKFRLRAEAQGCVPQERDMEMGPGQVREGVDFQLVAGQVIGGRVIDGQGRGVAEAEVIAADRLAVTDEGGRFELGPLEDSFHDVFVSHPTLDQALAERVPAGKTDLVIVLEPKGIVQGRVRRDDGTTPRRFLVHLLDDQGKKIDQLRGSDGSFELSLPAGPFGLVVRDGPWSGEALGLALEPGETKIIDISLTMANASLSGQIVDGQDHPLAMANVTLVEAQSQRMAGMGISDDQGSFRIPKLIPGEYHLRVTHSECPTKEIKGVTVQEAEWLGKITLLRRAEVDSIWSQRRFGGVGMRLRQEGGEIVVYNVLSGGAAEAEGLVAGDRIIAIDGMSSGQLTYAEQISRIRGEEGSVVVLRVRRGDMEMDVSMVRGLVDVNSNN